MPKTEPDFYKDIATTFESKIKQINPDLRVYYSMNKELPEMIKEINKNLGDNGFFSGVYVPRLKLDILFAIHNPVNNRSELILFEVKYSDGLKLINYSQLLGYLLTAKRIKIGILFLVRKAGTPPTGLSSDFNELKNSNRLPMNWTIKEHQDSMAFGFRTAICDWEEGCHIKFTQCSNEGGISSLRELVDTLSLQD